MKRLCLLLLIFTSFAAAQSTLSTFEIKEVWGVNHPDQPIEFAYSGGKPSLTNTRMLGPNGQEVAYEWESTCKASATGCIIVRSRLPNSVINLEYGANSATNTIGLTTVNIMPSIGEIFQIAAGPVATGLSLNTNYYVVSSNSGTGNIQIATTAGGTVLTYTAGSSMHIQQQALAFSGSTLTCPLCNFQNGDGISITTTGTMPTGLVSGTTYYVVNVSGQTFQLAATVGGSAITLSGSPSGLFSITVDWIWTLQSGVAPVAAPPNPVVVTINGNNWEITNGLTGFRTPTVPGNPSPWNKAPTQGIKLANGTWTGINGSNPNLLYTESAGGAGNITNALTSAARACGSAPCLTGFTSIFTNTGPLKTTIQLTYTFNRPMYNAGSDNLVSVDTTANTITLASALSYIMPNGPVLAQSTGQIIIFGANGGTLPGGISANVQYNAFLVPGTTQTYTLINTLTGVPVVITSNFTGGQFVYPMLTRSTAQDGIAGHHTVNITLYANSKSIIVDEDTDMFDRWLIPTYTEIGATQSRWRGAKNEDGSTGYLGIKCGYYGPFTVTAASNASPAVISYTGSSQKVSDGNEIWVSGLVNVPDGYYYAKQTGNPLGTISLYTNVNLSTPYTSSGTFSGTGTIKTQYRGQTDSSLPYGDGIFDISYTTSKYAGGVCNDTTTRSLITNYPAAVNAGGGVYDLLYNSAGTTTSPVLGIWEGRNSQQQYSAQGPSEPGIFSTNSFFPTAAPDSGIDVPSAPRGSDNNVRPLGSAMHRNWGIFVSTQADMVNPAIHQPIGTDLNIYSGINLSTLASYVTTYADPAGGWQPNYMALSGYNQLVSWMQNGTAVCGSTTCFATKMLASESSSPGKAILNLWQNGTAAYAGYALDSGTNYQQYLQNNNENGDGVYNKDSGYYQLGLSASPASVVSNAILLNSTSTASQKLLAKAQLAYFGQLFWDNDWFPIDNNSGDSDGLANQIQQYLQYRAQAATQIPALYAHINQAISSMLSDFSGYFSSTGAAAGSTHYQGTFFEPLYVNFASQSFSGNLSFANYPTWSKYAQWELSTQTPPEPRFGNVRKGYSNGDGETEADVRSGMLASGLNATNPTIAQNLMWAWSQSNSSTLYSHDNQFISTVATIDPTITSTMPTLGDINIPGYHSALRKGFNSTHETALWFINGGFYQSGGHRHADDGQVSIYAHNSPLAIDFNADLYHPSTPGRFFHNSIVYDSELGVSWSADSPTTTQADNWFKNPTNTEFSSFPDASSSIGTFTATDGTVWTRSVKMISPNLSYPIISTTDSFSGAGAASAKTLTWNLMATGATTTPSGSITPTSRVNTNCGSADNTFSTALPSNGTVNNLGSGLQHFNFTGYNWASNSAGGINWDLYTLSNVTTQQFLLGDWGHQCHSTREVSEYKSANSVGTFKEEQQILRVHDTGPFKTFILPYRKTETPTRSVSTQTCGTQIVQGSETTCFNDQVATWTDGTINDLFIFDTSSQSFGGVTASGGPQEVSINGTTITWTLSGGTGATRTITLPTGSWYPNTALSISGNTYSYYHGGGLQSSPITITFTQTPVTLKTIILSFPGYAGATNIRVKFGSAVSYAASVACSTACNVTLQSATGSQPIQWDYLDGSGNVLASSAQTTYLVN
jgi:hypothetical protein